MTVSLRFGPEGVGVVFCFLIIMVGLCGGWGGGGGIAQCVKHCSD